MKDPLDILVRGDVDAAVAMVTGLDEAGRRQLSADLVAHVRRRRDNWWARDEATALAVTAVGCLPSAAKAAEVVGRRSVSLRTADADRVITVARRRRITWLPDLAYRLADRLTRTDPTDGWRFITDLLTAENAPPPTGDRFVEGWLAEMAWPPERLRSLPVRHRLRTDPFLDALVPRLFEVDGIGTRMLFDEFMTDEKLALPRALAALAAEGRLDRAALLDGCLSRLLRDDRPAALRAFVVLHGLLEPTAAEIGARRDDHLRLLADAPGPVASMAQQALRSLNDLEVDALLDPSRAVLIRPEKALVRAQLSWLDQVARRQPDRASEIGAVLATAIDHPAPDVRDRAGALAARHGHRALPPAVTTVVGDDLPPPPPPTPAPPPITDPDELAEEVAAGNATVAMSLERILDGVVRLVSVDQQGVSRALRPVLHRQRAGYAEHPWDPCCLCALIGGVLYAAADQAQSDTRRGRWAALLAAWRRFQAPAPPPGDPRVPPPHRLLRARIAEVGNHLNSPRHAGLLSAPTRVNGAIDPIALYERLAQLGDRPPWPIDLAQALLRLPAGVDERLADEAAALRTPAGDQLAAWLRGGGLPRPRYRVVTVARRERRQPYDWQYEHLPRQRTTVQVSPPEGAEDQLGLLTVPTTPVGHTWHGDWSRLWPTVLPGYRGLVAAYLLPQIAGSADQDVRGGATVLPLLAESTGAGGPALNLALAYGLGARHDADRIAALDALLALAPPVTSTPPRSADTWAPSPQLTRSPSPDRSSHCATRRRPARRSPPGACSLPPCPRCCPPRPRPGAPRTC